MVITHLVQNLRTFYLHSQCLGTGKNLPLRHWWKFARLSHCSRSKATLIRLATAVFISFKTPGLPANHASRIAVAILFYL
jgi:hypothetical protein